MDDQTFAMLTKCLVIHHFILQHIRLSKFIQLLEQG